MAACCDSDHPVWPLGRPLPVEAIAPRIQALNARLHAVRVWRAPQPGARLHLLAKDNIGVEEFTTTAGSLALGGLQLPDAFCITRLKAAGMDVFGKTNMTELAGFLTTKNLELGYSHLGGAPQNPHGAFACGGSSSGSAVAVAAGLCDAALGTETRGSLMIPGLACGVWSCKPSVGLVSRSRVVPISEHFDTVGVMARDADTIATVIRAMAGFDEEDPVTQAAGAILGTGPGLDGERPPRLAVLEKPLDGAADDAQLQRRAVVENFLAVLRARGFDIVRAPLAQGRSFPYKTISSLDIRREMDRLLGRWATGNVPRTFEELCLFYRTHPEARPFGMDRLDDALAMAAMEPDEFRQLAADAVARARSGIESDCRTLEADGLMVLDFVDWWSIAGAPSLAVPIGKTPQGRPVGVMLGCPWGRDMLLMELARRIQRALQEAPGPGPCGQN